MAPLNVMDQFRLLQQQTPCPFASGAKLWAAPHWAAEAGIKENAKRICSHFRRYSSQGRLISPDGFVVEARWNTAGSMRRLAASFAELIASLSEFDTRREGKLRVSLAPGWQFAFEDVRYFLSVFSNVYAPQHIRHSPTSDFVFFQPEESFVQHGIGDGNPGTDSIKCRVQEIFERAGYTYPRELIDARIEAQLYILPRHANDYETRWWKYFT